MVTFIAKNFTMVIPPDKISGRKNKDDSFVTLWSNQLFRLLLLIHLLPPSIYTFLVKVNVKKVHKGVNKRKYQQVNQEPRIFEDGFVFEFTAK